MITDEDPWKHSAGGTVRGCVLGALFLPGAPNKPRRRAAKGRTRRCVPYHVISAGVLTADGIIYAAGSTVPDEDFSWEDEEEDVVPRGEPSPRLANAARELSHDRLMAAVTSGTTSPERSEDSYDLVSSGHASTTGDANVTRPHVNEESDGDSGEEEDDDGDDDDDDGESAESDWE